ncbi:MAG: hypothetical protein HQ534_10435 [Armatimonadetes bacterium]|nr:hypothetical protein [Armatimonadota bacterium]
MSKPRFDDLLKVVLSKRPSKEKLKKLGMTQEELDRFLDSLLYATETKAYNRILSEDEKRVLTPAAFGYLVHLLKIKSIDRELFENIISLSLQLNVFLRKKIDKPMMDNIVNYLIFSGQGEISVRDLIENFFIHETDFDFEEDIH